MFFLQAIKSERFIRREYSVADFSVGSFIRDETWHNLDLSAIVPVGALTVIISGYIIGNAKDKFIQFNGYGVTVILARIGAQTEVAGGVIYYNGQLPLDSSRTIQYRVKDTNVTVISFVVSGWTILQ